MVGKWIRDTSGVGLGVILRMGQLGVCVIVGEGMFRGAGPLITRIRDSL